MMRPLHFIPVSIERDLRACLLGSDAPALTPPPPLAPAPPQCQHLSLAKGIAMPDNTHDAHDRFPPTPAWTAKAWLSPKSYDELYQHALTHPDHFWDQVAERLTWYQRWTQTKDVSFTSPVKIAWYLNGKLNVSYNCLDRHLPHHKDRVAYYFEPEAANEPARAITYGELKDRVCQAANALKELGVRKGDRVTVYLPMIPEAIITLLACARIGAVHSMVFAGFSADALADRITDCESDFLVTADEGWRGGKPLPLKSYADQGMAKANRTKKALIVKRTGAPVAMANGRDHWFHELVDRQSKTCQPEIMDAEDPLFLLYTSGSTNKPKGVLHTTGGYLTWASYTHEVVFDYHAGDVYWCAADIGWVTGHTYIVYGPLANGATSVLYEGLPTYPTPSRLWEVIDKYKVNTLYTAPTLIRALMAQGDQAVTRTSRESLRLLGSVGEPINPEAWRWYHRVPGRGTCPIVDTWWQTETGGILISPLPGATTLKPGSATRPLPGIQPRLVNEKGEILDGATEGHLCLATSWPGQMRTVYKDHARFEQTYFSTYPGLYFSGDGCRRDADGDYWITGRVDDVLNVSGHRIGTAEVESALVAHAAVAEAAVVGCPHEIKGQGIYAFVTLNSGLRGSDTLSTELAAFVKDQIGGLAKPDYIQFADGLPKTRSGKIMRRILRKIAEGAPENELGDTSTLADPGVVKDLMSRRVRR